MHMTFLLEWVSFLGTVTSHVSNEAVGQGLVIGELAAAEFHVGQA